MKRWVAIELTHMGETETDLEKLRKEVKRVVSDAEVFIPAHTFKKRGKTYNKSLMEGYLFAVSEDNNQFFELENTTYFKSVLSTPAKGGRYPTPIRDNEIEKMRSKMAHMYRVGISVDDTVMITEGLYKDLEAVVIEVKENEVLVQVSLRSIESILELPKLWVKRI